MRPDGRLLRVTICIGIGLIAACSIEAALAYLAGG